MLRKVFDTILVVSSHKIENWAKMASAHRLKLKKSVELQELKGS